MGSDEKQKNQSAPNTRKNAKTMAHGDKQKFICDRCGSEMAERNCKIICPNCGNRFDCSDLNIYFD